MMSGEQRRSSYPELREMPASVETEQAVLGALLLDNSLYERIADILTPQTFYEGHGSLHRDIFEIMAAWIPAGRVVNAITIKAQLGERDLGGTTLSQYLASLRANAGLPQEVRGYAKILHDLHVRRVVIGIAEDARDRAYFAPVEDTAKTLVDSVLERLGELRLDTGERGGFEDFESVSLRAVMAAEASFKAGGQLVGLSTGLARLDEGLGGLRPTDFIVLAGRPAMGKSALAGQIGFNVARALQAKRNAGEKTGVVAVFSLEMSKEQFVERLVCARANVASWKIRRGKLTADDVRAMDDARREIGRVPFKIDATPGLNIQQLSLKAKALAKRHGLALIVVDYLQMMPGLTKSDNRTREVTEITQGLKNLAKELEVPVIGLSQLNRDLERRDDKRPILADLKESGSIEQDADVVMFVYREEYYLGKPPPDGTEARLNWERKRATVEGIAEVIIGKNRHGPTGYVELGFEASATRFLDQPAPRNGEYEPLPREKPKDAAPRLPRRAVIALGLLKDLTQSSPVLTPGLENVPRWVSKPVSYLLWRERCAAELLDVSRDERAAAKLMEEVVTPLKDHSLVQRGGTKDEPYVWLTEEGRNALPKRGD